MKCVGWAYSQMPRSFRVQVTFDFSWDKAFAPVRVTCGPYAPAGTAQVGGSLALAEISDPRCQVRGPSPTPSPTRDRRWTRSKEVGAQSYLLCSLGWPRG
ncbi:hypothetical protein GCM10022251_48450 [Phytohabitans flavus]|uniref:Uncharacterized protein n=1 Tax=Phytohabitans flavus TaxID=1076124 RepID=A0A6F8XSS4_9ACTN|nr:hypothetical protein Pflav_033120 [Phytohabitans flavus]